MPDPEEIRAWENEPAATQDTRDDATQVPGEFGVDADPYTEDDSEGAGDDEGSR